MDTNFTDQVATHALALKGYALFLTQNKEEAHDLLQETYLKAFSNRDRFAPDTNLKGWLYTIMKNTFITQYQRMVRRNTFIDTTDNLHYINSMESLQQNDAINSFVNQDIQSALAKIDHAYRVPFMMYFEGFKYHEIAEELDLPIGTVKNRIFMARRDLKNHLHMYA